MSNAAFWILGIMALGIFSILAYQLYLQLGKNEDNEWKGKYKELFAADANLKSEMKVLAKERDDLHREIEKYRAEEKQNKEDLKRQTEQLKNAKEGYDSERQRVIREDEEATKKREEERDRLWAEHEHSVVAELTDLCKQPALSFTTYSNTNLPEGFDGSLKPDFMVEFLGQYVIFDAKVSKAKSLQTYISKQVEDTVEKVKGNDKIYKWIFLVVPTQAMTELKKHHYIIEGYNVFVVAPESLPAILACLKHITFYEFAEQIDPHQRENMVQTLAELDFHINLRNAADIVLTRMATDLLEKTQRADPELAEEIALKKQPMNAKASLSVAEIKKIVSDFTTQNIEIQKLVSPKTAIKAKTLKEAGTMLEDTLS